MHPAQNNILSKVSLSKLPSFIENEIVSSLSERAFGEGNTAPAVTTEIFKRTLAHAQTLTADGNDLNDDTIDEVCAKLMGNGWIILSEIHGKRNYYEDKLQKGSLIYKIHNLYEKFLGCLGLKTTLEKKTDLLAMNQGYLTSLLKPIIGDSNRWEKIKTKAEIYAGAWLAKELAPGSQDKSISYSFGNDDETCVSAHAERPGVLISRPNMKPQHCDPFDLVTLQGITAQKKNVSHLIAEDSENNRVKKIRILRPNGDVIAFDHSTKPSLGQGSGRTVFQGTLQTKEGVQKQIAVVSTLPRGHWDSLTSDILEEKKSDIAAVNSKLGWEQTVLSRLNGQTGIIQSYGYDKLSVGGVEFCFEYLDLCPQGNLEDFMKSREFQAMNSSQKERFIASLLHIFNTIQLNGEIHRDVNLKNILVKFNDGTKCYEPVLIDFEFFLFGEESEQKTEVSGDPLFWAPEYVEVCKKYPAEYLNAASGKPVSPEFSMAIANATTAAKDTWALGVVLYRLWYGQDLLAELGMTNPQDIPASAKPGWLYNAVQNIEKVFGGKNIENDPVGQLIKKMLNLKPEERPTRLVLPERKQATESTSTNALNATSHSSSNLVGYWEGEDPVKFDPSVYPELFDIYHRNPYFRGESV